MGEGDKEQFLGGGFHMEEDSLIPSALAKA